MLPTNIGVIGTKRDAPPFAIACLSNPNKKDVYVAYRDDFILWLPGATAQHIAGKYEVT